MKYNSFYRGVLTEIRDNLSLNSMASVKILGEIGMNLNMVKTTKVFDLCCGNGYMLMLWNIMFGINGFGIDINDQDIIEGNDILRRNEIDDVKLLERDVRVFESEEKYDVVSMVGKNLFGDVKLNIEHMGKYVKEDGFLVYGTAYKKLEIVPGELIEYEGALLTLYELYKIFRSMGYIVSDFISGKESQQDRYVASDARRILGLDENPYGSLNKEKLALADEKYKMHFLYQRRYERYALFVLKKI